MQKSTIAQLNKLNSEFYTTVASDFDNSRNHYWPGWIKLLEHIDAEKISSVLDIGCGNGRFGSFATEHFHNLANYTGIDSNQQLLDAAKTANPSGDFLKNDIVSNFLSGSPLVPTDQKFNLIAIFGVMHHIPSFELRAQLIKAASSLLTESGTLVFTTWQFMEFERLRKKTINPHEINIRTHELEDEDYFLDWQRGPLAIRYCHYFTPGEVAKLLHATNLSQISTYRADGKEESVNSYYIVTPLKYQKQS
ncbi:MAG: class I SAM-dependent methyltransferase [Pseudomonadales bacterium]|nr:class I SAM-dependent methyltransferase [Candidatus Woesebacteria bacterium]MCB9800645.1 class I SAM-dependent methyltransferase [Pseudomonadales bacterium]